MGIRQSSRWNALAMCKNTSSNLRPMKKRLNETQLDDGMSIGGTGQLTLSTVNKLQVYYGRAIRNNTFTRCNMLSCPFGIICNCQMKANYDLCPPGEHSWCGYQKDLALGTSDYKHGNILSRAVTDTIYPIFENLSEENLLKRCVHGGTQNQNESINALIWQ